MLNYRHILSLYAALVCLCLFRGASASGPIYPHDPPVTENGEGLYEGLSGNDWEDFPDHQFVASEPVGLFKVGNVFIHATVSYFRETPDNGLFNYDENRVSDGTGVEHLCPRVDFDNFRYPGDNLVQAANDYWTWFYEGYFPAVYASTTPPVGFQQNRATTRNNCVSFAFNRYASENTRLGWWVEDTPALSLVRGELYAIWDRQNCNTGAVMNGDRCITCNVRSDSIPTAHGEASDQTWYPWSSTFAWWVNDELANGTLAARHIMWKNGTSQIFEWDHQQPHNCSPRPVDTYMGMTIDGIFSHEFEVWRNSSNF